MNEPILPEPRIAERFLHEPARKIKNTCFSMIPLCFGTQGRRTPSFRFLLTKSTSSDLYHVHHPASPKAEGRARQDKLTWDATIATTDKSTDPKYKKSGHGTEAIENRSHSPAAQLIQVKSHARKILGIRKRPRIFKNSMHRRGRNKKVKEV